MGADAHRAQAQLQQAQQKGGQLAVESATLAQALEQEAAVNKQNSTEIAHLEQQLQSATKQANEASKTLEKASYLYTSTNTQQCEHHVECLQRQLGKAHKGVNVN